MIIVNNYCKVQREVGGIPLIYVIRYDDNRLTEPTPKEEEIFNVKFDGPDFDKDSLTGFRILTAIATRTNYDY